MTHTDTTSTATAASFPIPFPHTEPFDDVDDALAMLQVVYELMSDDRGFGPEFSRQVSIVLAQAIDKLQPVGAFLNRLGGEKRFDSYLDARREWIRGKAGRS